MANNDHKYFLGRAGEHGTVAQLLKLKIYASLTGGNRKSIDIIAARNSKSATVQVKTTETARFTTNFYQKYYDYTIPYPDFWVFVHFNTNGSLVSDERYFVLTHDEVKVIQGNIVIPLFKDVGAKTVEDVMAIEKAKKQNKIKPGVDSIPLKLLLPHENRFDKIATAL